MTHKQRFITALELKIPDYVPTFEAEFQLAPELVGGDFLREEDLNGLSKAEIYRKLDENVDFILKVYDILEHDAICLHYLNEEHILYTAERIQKITNGEYMLMTHGDGTYAIPNGNGMMEFALRIADDPEGVEADARRMADNAIAHNRRFLDGGFDGFILCSDYCFNMGPFLSPDMFRQFVTPYLTDITADIRARGGYAIKHTDGDIMPIIDQLVESNPHALHSIDPMAGVDIRVVKEQWGDRVALCGNVHCAAMQTGTEEEVIASSEYCLTHGKPGGGYIYCTSNVPFRGLPLERYMLVLDVWKKHRMY